MGEPGISCSVFRGADICARMRERKGMRSVPALKLSAATRALKRLKLKVLSLRKAWALLQTQAILHSVGKLRFKQARASSSGMAHVQHTVSSGFDP